MTKDEILRLEAGRELDALVAEKVMDYKRGDVAGQEVWATKEPEGMLIRFVGDDFMPSKEIGHAWQVVEKMSKRDTVYIYLYEGGCSILHGFYQEKLASADTAPLAICRAALLAVMEEAE